MTSNSRKIKLVLIAGLLLCLVLVLALSRTTSSTARLQDRIRKQQDSLRLSSGLAKQIQALAPAAAQTADDDSAFHQLRRVSFADDLALQLGLPSPTISDPKTESHEGYQRVVHTIQYENLTLQQLGNFLFEAEQIPGIIVWEISPLAPTPGKNGKWKATMKLVAVRTLQ